MFVQNAFIRSHILVDVIVTECLLNDDWMVTGKVDFIYIPVNIQWPFSQLFGRHISVTFHSKAIFGK